MLSGILCCIYCHVFESPKQISLNLPGILVTSCHLVIVTHTRTQPPGLETMSLDIAHWAFPGLASLTSPALCNDEGLAPYPHSASCTSVPLPVLLCLEHSFLTPGRPASKYPLWKAFPTQFLGVVSSPSPFGLTQPRSCLPTCPLPQ